jgi:hypothetical protein
MAARTFHCEIQNTGEGPLILTKSVVSEGEWSNGLDPSKSATAIAPGEIKIFQAESSGILKGTQGLVTFRTQADDLRVGEHPEWLRITWDIPYIKLGPAEAPEMVKPWTSRFDPDADDPFANPDRAFADIQTSVYYSAGPVSFLDMLKNTPEVFVATVAEPFMAFFGGTDVPDDVYCYLIVSGSVADADHTLSFPTGPTKMPIPLPLHDSNLSQWAGVWQSDHVTASIVEVAGKLNVSVQEQTATGTRTLTGQGLQINHPAIHTIAQRDSALAATAGQGTSSATSAIGLKDRVQGLAGSVARAAGPTIAGNSATSTDVSITGDYVSLQDDATLEIFQLLQGKNAVGQAMRFVRPTSRAISVLGSIDEMMNRKPHIA